MTLSFAVAEGHHLDAPAHEDFEALVQHPYVQAAVAIRTIHDIHGTESKTFIVWYCGPAGPRNLTIGASARSQISGSFTRRTLSAGIGWRCTVARVRIAEESLAVAT